jgi:hypothetical protein
MQKQDFWLEGYPSKKTGLFYHLKNEAGRWKKMGKEKMFNGREFPGVQEKKDTTILKESTLNTTQLSCNVDWEASG